MAAKYAFAVKSGSMLSPRRREHAKATGAPPHRTSSPGLRPGVARLTATLTGSQTHPRAKPGAKRRRIAQASVRNTCGNNNFRFMSPKTR